MTNDTLKYNDMPISEIASNAKQDLTREVGNRINQAKETVQKTVSATKDYVKENPLTSLAIVLGVGVVVGFLASRRS